MSDLLSGPLIFDKKSRLFHCSTTLKWDFARLSYLILLCFFIFYDIEFSFLPFLTSARLAVILLLITSFFNINLNKSFLLGLFIFLICFIYSFLQFLFVGDSTQSIRIFWFIVLGWIVPLLFIYSSFRFFEFSFSVFIAGLIQSVLVLVMFFNYDFRVFTLQLINTSTNISETEILQRAFGFTSLTGSSLSIVQALTFFSGLLFLRISPKLKFWPMVLFWLSMLCILFSMVLIGRTGLLISLFALFVYFILYQSWVLNLSIILFLAFLISVFDFIQLFTSLTSDLVGFNSDWFVDWIREGFSFRSNSTVEQLKEMYVPPLSFKTLLGTGRVISENGLTNASLNDSGYVQTYFSLGLFMSVLFYVSFLFLSFYRWLLGERNIFILFLLVILFLIEYKEPFIFKYAFPCFLTTILLFNYKHEAN
jgi:hypothetical protein